MHDNMRILFIRKPQDRRIPRLFYLPVLSAFSPNQVDLERGKFFSSGDTFTLLKILASLADLS
jgi:hypothetical protein